ncbi:MAG: LPS export ABC transporter periplasmic protein LptC [bacterium]
MSNLWTMHLRRAALWAIPAALVAALVWSALPRGGGEPVTPPPLPAPAAPSAASSGAAGTSGAGSAGQTGSPQGGAGGDSQAAPAAAAGASASSPDAQGGAGTAQPPSSGVASGEIKLGNLVGTDDQGHVRWRILADDMTLQQAQQTVALKNVRATFFDNDGSRMLVNGETGAYNTRTREVTVGGNVHGVTSTGRELFADTVHYSPQSRQVEGRGHVRVVQERVIMYADSMISDLTLGQTRFFGNVHMTLR